MVTRQGNPEREIIRLAAEEQVDLIVIDAGIVGDAPHGPGKHPLGRVARFVVDHALCDVLLIRRFADPQTDWLPPPSTTRSTAETKATAMNSEVLPNFSWLIDGRLAGMAIPARGGDARRAARTRGAGGRQPDGRAIARVARSNGTAYRQRICRSWILPRRRSRRRKRR